MYRCIKDFFGYCLHKPNSELKQVSVTLIDYRGEPYKYLQPTEVCLNDPRTCSQYQTQSQRYPAQAAGETTA